MVPMWLFTAFLNATAVGVNAKDVLGGHAGTGLNVLFALNVFFVLAGLVMAVVDA